MAETASVGILAVGFGKLNWEEAAKGAAVPCHQRVAAEIPQGHLLVLLVPKGRTQGL